MGASGPMRRGYGNGVEQITVPARLGCCGCFRPVEYARAIVSGFLCSARLDNMQRESHLLRGAAERIIEGVKFPRRDPPGFLPTRGQQVIQMRCWLLARWRALSPAIIHHHPRPGVASTVTVVLAKGDDAT